MSETEEHLLGLVFFITMYELSLFFYKQVEESFFFKLKKKTH